MQDSTQGRTEVAVYGKISKAHAAKLIRSIALTGGAPSLVCAVNTKRNWYSALDASSGKQYYIRVLRWLKDRADIEWSLNPATIHRGMKRAAVKALETEVSNFKSPPMQVFFSTQ